MARRGAGRRGARSRAAGATTPAGGKPETAAAARREGAERAFKKAASRLADEYFCSADAGEALWALGEAVAEAEALAGEADWVIVRLFVKRLITLALDRGAREREMAACLLAALRGEGVRASEVEAGLALLLDSLDDLALDVPDAPGQLTLFLARAVLDDAASRGFVDERACGDSSAAAAARAARSLLRAPGGAARVRGAWGGRDGSSVEASKAVMDSLLEEYVSSLDRAEAERRLRALAMPFYHHEFVKRALYMAITYAERRPALVDLLAGLCGSGCVSASQMAAGFERTVERLPDLRLDVPDARASLALLAAELRAARLLPARLSAWAMLQQRKTGSGSLRLGSESCLGALAAGAGGTEGDAGGGGGGAVSADGGDGWHRGMARVRPMWSGLRAPTVSASRASGGSGVERKGDAALFPAPVLSLRGRAHFASSPNLCSLDTTELVKPECRARSYLNFFDEYELGAFLGSGGFAAVYRCTHKRTGARRAVKVVRVSASDDAGETGDDEARESEMALQEVMNELAFLSTLGDHPSVVKVHQYFLDESTMLCHIVMDLLEGGELMEALESVGSYTEDSVRLLMRRLFEAVQHLHFHNCVHRDLKMENLMLARANDLGSLTLVDFGLAKTMHARAREREQCGTAWYMSPELLLGVPYGRAVDCWACGVIMWALLTGAWPFGDEEEDEDAVADEVVEGMDFDEAFARPEWRDISAEAQDLLRGLLSSSVRARLTAVEALEHAWFLGAERGGGTIASVEREEGGGGTSHLAAQLSETHARLEALSRARRQAMPLRSFGAGERIAVAGRTYTECLLVKSGEATILDEDGRAVGALGVGALIGEVCASPRSGAPAPRTVVAASQLTCSVIAGEAMELAAALDYRRAPDFRAALDARRRALRKVKAQAKAGPLIGC